MGSASSTYRPKCIYLDIDGRIQKVLSLFFTKWRLRPRPRAVFAAPIPKPRVRIPFPGEKGGFSCVPAALYTDVDLKGKGRLAGGRAGRCQHRLAASSPCRRGDARFRSRLGFHSRRAVFTKFSEVFSPAGSGIREAQLLGDCLSEGSAPGSGRTRLSVRCRCIAGGCGVPATSAQVAPKCR